MIGCGLPSCDFLVKIILTVQHLLGTSHSLPQMWLTGKHQWEFFGVLRHAAAYVNTVSAPWRQRASSGWQDQRLRGQYALRIQAVLCSSRMMCITAAWLQTSDSLGLWWCGPLRLSR